MKIILMAALPVILFAASVSARPMPPPGPLGVPSTEELATVPNLTVAQQIELRKVLIQRRDAQETANATARVDFDALRVKERTARERIDEQASEQLRKLLGDNGYFHYAQCELSHRGPPIGGPDLPMRPHRDRAGGEANDVARPPAASRDAPANGGDE